ncbi:MAG TPA: methylornithine synthase PylB [Desulfobacteraceae bacterium]|nr:methylornithine synthase PylB [Desulfobacteraceae bacterium]
MPQGVFKKLEQDNTLGREDIMALLNLRDPADIQRLFRAARQTRKRVFGTSVFLYGFLYFSTHCRNNCRFCQYRRANTGLERYRKTMPEILRAAGEMARAGVHLIDLTMGEDPQFYRSGFLPLINLTRAVKRETGLPVMVSPGVVPDTAIEGLAAAGADWLACYQETYNPALYSTLRQGQDFEPRMAAKRTAVRKGMLVEEGLLAGVGERIDDLADAIAAMQDNPFDQVRIMTFVPQPGTPMATASEEPASGAGRLTELKTIAVMRLAMPDRLIPASLDVDGLDGLRDRLNAGANVVTSIVPPGTGLAGVAHKSLDIEEARRSVALVSCILKDCGLETASREQYGNWIRERKALRHKTTIGAA